MSRDKNKIFKFDALTAPLNIGKKGLFGLMLSLL